MAFGDLKGTLTNSGTTAGTSVTSTGSVAVAVGDLIIGFYTERLAVNITAMAVAPTGLVSGNALTAVNAGTLSSVASRMYYGVVTAAGTLTTLTGTITNTGQAFAFVGAVFQGPFLASGVLDTAPANTTDAVTPFTCAATGTLAQANELIVAGCALTRGQTATTATSPLLLAVNAASGAANSANSVSGSIGRQAVSATTTQTPVFACATGTINGAVQIVATFKQGPPSGALALTEQSDAIAAAATLGPVTGTLNRTEVNDTLAAAGGPVVSGPLARTEAPDTLAAAGAIGAAPPPLWTPASLGPDLLLWLDVADAATIHITGSGISQWDDKSGNARHVTQGTDALRPTYSPSPPYVGLYSGLFFNMVASPTAYDMAFTGYGFATDVRGIWLVAGTAYYGLLTDAAGQLGDYVGSFHGSGQTWTANVPGIVYTQLSNTANQQISLNGASFSSTGTTVPDCTPFYLGTSQPYSVGNVYEVVLATYNSPLATRQLIEGYLAWKWGNDALLPSGHPYKSAAPVLQYGVNVRQQDQTLAATGTVPVAATLLVHFDTATIIDASAYAHTLTPTGLISTTTANPKFGARSGLFGNDAAALIDTGNASDFNFGSSPFTIEAWCYFSIALPSPFGTIISQWEDIRGIGGANLAWTFFFYNGVLSLGWSTGGDSGTFGMLQATSYTIPLNQWVHLAVDRDGSGILRLYTDGTVQASVSAPVFYDASVNCLIGNDQTLTRATPGMYLDELRVVRGLAVYGGAFTPPTGPFLPADPTSGITGTLAVTEANDTIVSAGTVPYAVTQAETGAAADTQSATAILPSVVVAETGVAADTLSDTDTMPAEAMAEAGAAADTVGFFAVAFSVAMAEVGAALDSPAASSSSVGYGPEEAIQSSPLIDLTYPGPYRVGNEVHFVISGQITKAQFHRPAASAITSRSLFLYEAVNGTLVATSNASVGEAGTGWVQVAFPSPIPVAAGSNYVISYDVSDLFSYGGSAPSVTNAAHATWVIGRYGDMGAGYPAGLVPDTNYSADLIWQPQLSGAVAIAETGAATDAQSASIGAATYNVAQAETAAAIDTQAAQAIPATVAMSETGSALDHPAVSGTAYSTSRAEIGTAIDTISTTAVYNVAISEAGLARDSVNVNYPIGVGVLGDRLQLGFINMNVARLMQRHG